MEEVYFKKHWAQKDITYYLHFRDNMAIRQIEIGPTFKKFLSAEDPEQLLQMDDQPLDELELNKDELITKDEFDKIWMTSLV